MEPAAGTIFLAVATLYLWRARILPTKTSPASITRGHQRANISE
jgi:hypothetical protein